MGGCTTTVAVRKREVTLFITNVVAGDIGCNVHTHSGGVGGWGSGSVYKDTIKKYVFIYHTYIHIYT
jgi:hypothetical protein